MGGSKGMRNAIVCSSSHHQKEEMEVEKKLPNNSTVETRATRALISQLKTRTCKYFGSTLCAPTSSPALSSPAEITTVLTLVLTYPFL